MAGPTLVDLPCPTSLGIPAQRTVFELGAAPQRRQLLDLARKLRQQRLQVAVADVAPRRAARDLPRRVVCGSGHAQLQHAGVDALQRLELGGQPRGGACARRAAEVVVLWPGRARQAGAAGLRAMAVHHPRRRQRNARAGVHSSHARQLGRRVRTHRPWSAACVQQHAAVVVTQNLRLCALATHPAAR